MTKTPFRSGDWDEKRIERAVRDAGVRMVSGRDSPS
jgi:hypothetical protein